MGRQIGQILVSVHFGDITQHRVDAYVVPQFTNCASFGGVGGAIHRAGGTEGLAEYDKRAAAKPYEFGAVDITPSGGGNASYLLHG